MSTSKSGVDRRQFFRIGSGAAAAGILGARVSSTEDPPSGPKSRVVLIRERHVLDDEGRLDEALLHDMVNRAVQSLFEADSPSEAWKRVVSPGDVVGIKTNVWRHLPTPPALEDAIRSEVVAAGVEPENLAVDDRGVRTNPVFQRATALINVRPMRTHNWSGLGTCLKNMIMFVPRPPEYHGDSCAPLGAMWKLPELEGKVRLNILVMLTPQFHGVGPHSFSKDYVWPYRGLIVGIDPVAVDATGARIIRAKRDLYFGEPSPVSPPAHHIELADSRYGLGHAAPEAIDLVRFGWQEDLLI